MGDEKDSDKKKTDFETEERRKDAQDPDAGQIGHRTTGGGTPVGPGGSTPGGPPGRAGE